MPRERDERSSDTKGKRGVHLKIKIQAGDWYLSRSITTRKETLLLLAVRGAACAPFRSGLVQRLTRRTLLRAKSFMGVMTESIFSG